MGPHRPLDKHLTFVAGPGRKSTFLINLAKFCSTDGGILFRIRTTLPWARPRPSHATGREYGRAFADRTTALLDGQS